MKTTIICGMIFAATAFVSASGTIINIPDDYPTIQEGIDASTDGDTVLVQPNTYYGSINFNGHNIVLGSLFLTTGDTSYISSTIIWGYSASTTVTFDNGEDITCKLMGLTLTARGSLYEYVTGIKCINSSPTISKNSIVNYDNIPEGPFGAGISCYDNSQPIISRNIIAYNSGHTGGAIYSYSSQPLILNNVITFNSANRGGGICADYSQLTIIGNIIRSNVSHEGGGIELYGDSSSVIYNNIIANNTSGYGGGIICRHRSSPIISNNLIINNFAVYGGGIRCSFYSNPIVKNTIFWADSAETGNEIDNSSSWPSFTYCDIEGGWYGEGNIDIDPLFRDPENGDFHLMSIACGDTYDSPCIDAGDPSIEDILLDCGWGLGTSLSDIGAYGGGDSTMVGIDDDKEPEVPIRFGLSQNYPNPFNASTIINYTLPKKAVVSIEIYNILGRKVETLVQEEQPAGYHQVVWDGKDKNGKMVSTGIYFYELYVDDYRESIAMILIK